MSDEAGFDYERTDIRAAAWSAGLRLGSALFVLADAAVDAAGLSPIHAAPHAAGAAGASAERPRWKSRH